MKDKLVTIANFIEPFPADLAKIKLESEDIKCFLSGQNFVSTYWLLSNANGGIKLQVRESDAEKALEILANNEGLKPEEFEDEDLESEQIELQCPNCGNGDVEYEKYSRKVFFLSILILRFPIPLLKRTYKCKKCGYCWQ